MNRYKTSSDRIMCTRKMAGLGRPDMELRHNINRNTLASWELGRNTLTKKGAESLSKAFLREGILCSPQWLLEGGDQLPTFINDRGQPIANSLSADSDQLCLLQEVEAFKAINPDPICIMVNDDGMMPIYKIGDYVAGNYRVSDFAGLIGHNCIIETYHGDLYIRKLLQGNKSDTYTLSCINPTANVSIVMPDIKIKRAAYITWHRQSDIDN